MRDRSSILQRSYRLDEAVTLYLVTQVGIPELRNANRLIKQLPRRAAPPSKSWSIDSTPASQGIDEEHVAKALTRAHPLENPQ